MNLVDLSRWARGSGLEAVLVVLGTLLVARFVRWTADRLIARARSMDERANLSSLVASEASKHRGALVQVLAWSVLSVVYFLATMVVLERLNVPVRNLVAPAAVLGAALGFGSQRLVQDILSGIFLFAERQYGFGDVIRIAPVGATAGIAGTVEEITLRTTKLRTIDGELVIVPNGEVRQVTNLSKDWARAVLDIPIASDADVAMASDILGDVGKEVWADEAWAPLLLDAPNVMGLENIGLGYLQLRFVARTLPGRQWEVSRELRRRTTEAFRAAGIASPPPMVAAADAGER
ncbi:MAG: mechanosensitive ion channel family protein [Actinomycetes bacterium]